MGGGLPARRCLSSFPYLTQLNIGGTGRGRISRIRNAPLHLGFSTKYMLREVSIALVFLTAASCATIVSYETARESLQRAKSCCGSMAQFRYEPLAKGEGVRFSLDASSSAFTFESGKSYFKAFRLVDEAIPYRIRISSFALGETIDRAHIFYPQVALLDERFAVLRQSAPGDFVLSKMSLKEAAAQTMGLPIKLEGSILVDSPHAKYVLVFTTQALMAGSSSYETRRPVPVILPGLVTAIPTRKETVPIRYSPFALLNVSITPAGAMSCPGGRGGHPAEGPHHGETLPDRAGPIVKEISIVPRHAPC